MSLANMPCGKKEQLAERRVLVLAHRKDGLTTRQIAKLVNTSASTVRSDLRASLAELRKERLALAEDVLELELSKLESLEAALKLGIAKGDTNAVHAMLGIHDRRVRLLGIGAPAGVNIGIGNAAIQIVLNRLPDKPEMIEAKPAEITDAKTDLGSPAEAA